MSAYRDREQDILGIEVQSPGHPHYDTEAAAHLAVEQAVLDGVHPNTSYGFLVAVGTAGERVDKLTREEIVDAARADNRYIREDRGERRDGREVTYFAFANELHGIEGALPSPRSVIEGRARTTDEHTQRVDEFYEGLRAEVLGDEERRTLQRSAIDTVLRETLGSTPHRELTLGFISFLDNRKGEKAGYGKFVLRAEVAEEESGLAVVKQRAAEADDFDEEANALIDAGMSLLRTKLTGEFSHNSMCQAINSTLDRPMSRTMRNRIRAALQRRSDMLAGNSPNHFYLGLGGRPTDESGDPVVVVDNLDQMIAASRGNTARRRPYSRKTGHHGRRTVLMDDYAPSDEPQEDY